MTKEELQIENGNFTRIINPLIEELIKIPFKGCELAVAIFIIRKTYGFQKTEDEISLTQFQKGLNRSRQTIITALKNLKLVNVAILAKKGNTKGLSNTWRINKYFETWKLVNMARLVQRNDKPSLTERLNLVQTARHTKETTKETTKERESDFQSQEINSFINLFKEVNPNYETLFRNKTERGSAERLLKKFGSEKMVATLKKLPEIINLPYAPKITSPYQLERDLGKLLAFVEQNKTKINSKKTKIAFT